MGSPIFTLSTTSLKDINVYTYVGITCRLFVGILYLLDFVKQTLGIFSM